MLDFLGCRDISPLHLSELLVIFCDAGLLGGLVAPSGAKGYRCIQGDWVGALAPLISWGTRVVYGRFLLWCRRCGGPWMGGELALLRLSRWLSSG